MNQPEDARKGTRRSQNRRRKEPNEEAEQTEQKVPTKHLRKDTRKSQNWRRQAPGDETEQPEQKVHKKHSTKCAKSRYRILSGQKLFKDEKRQKTINVYSKVAKTTNNLKGPDKEKYPAKNRK